MSAFQVEPETIHDVCEAWRRYSKQPLDLNALGRDLICLNADAVHHRYCETDAEADADRNAAYEEALAYRWQPTTASIHQLAKSVDCLICQCSSGEHMNLPQFKALEALALCIPVDRKGDAYNRASWAYWEKFRDQAC